MYSPTNIFLALFFIILSFNASAVEAYEYEIKATYLFNFAKFTDWPPEKLDKVPLSLCVFGKGQIKDSLEKLTKGKFIKERPLEVKLLASVEEAKFCHLLFVGTYEVKDLGEHLHKLSAQKVLCVGDTPGFLDNGGQIQFFVKEEKVGFEINLPAVEKSGLKIDARVLSLAKIRR